MRIVARHGVATSVTRSSGSTLAKSRSRAGPAWPVANILPARWCGLAPAGAIHALLQTGLAAGAAGRGGAALAVWSGRAPVESATATKLLATLARPVTAVCGRVLSPRSSPTASRGGGRGRRHSHSVRSKVGSTPSPAAGVRQHVCRHARIRGSHRSGMRVGMLRVAGGKHFSRLSTTRPRCITPTRFGNVMHHLQVMRESKNGGAPSRAANPFIRFSTCARNSIRPAPGGFITNQNSVAHERPAIEMRYR